MKKTISALSLIFVILAGCNLEDSNRGVSCPPDGSGKLTYIYSTSCTSAQTCQEAKVSNVTENNFTIGFCPQEMKCFLNDDGAGYHCGDCNGMRSCDSMCLNPLNDKQCGADDCKAKNYGGYDCTAKGVLWECQTSGDKDFACGCKEEAVMCDGQCIDPLTDSLFCGARGACSSEAADDDNFMGWNCASARIPCKDGTCQCAENKFWCEIDNAAKCYDPSQNETCGLNENCEYTVCKANEQCTLAKDGKYKCFVQSCPSTQQKCGLEEYAACFEMTNIEHCGTCLNNCTIPTFKYAHGAGCKFNDDDFSCVYQCDDSYTNCGNDFAPDCHDLKNEFDNCGACGNKCPEDKICNEGVCIETTCLPNQCTQVKGKGVDCVNETSKCGKNCEDCLNMDENGKCEDGVCKIRCNPGQYPIYSGAEIISCKATSDTVCAAADMPVDKAPVDCNDSKPANAETMGCSEAGECIITMCAADYHLSEDKKSCVKNTDTECAPTDSNIIKDCNTLENVAKGTCESGACKITKCQAGYHIAADSFSCVANSNTSCAPVTSSEAVDCTSDPLTVACDSEGYCACDAEGIMYPNFNHSVCIIKKCRTFTGAIESTCTDEDAKRCIPTKCTPKSSTNGGCASKWGSCQYKCSVHADCKALTGWKNGSCTTGNCIATSCQEGYVVYHSSCLSVESCCGSDCIDCTSRGLHCSGNSSKAKCE